MMKVLDWKDYPTIGGEDALIRYNEVTEKLKEKKAASTYRNFIREIMHDKHIKFKKETFKKLADHFLALKLTADGDARKSIQKNFWKNELADISLHGIKDKEVFMDSPFFSVNDEVWTVRDFKRALMSHPLVYRKNRISSREFNDQFKFAVADLVRDYYLNKEAYKK